MAGKHGHKLGNRAMALMGLAGLCLAATAMAVLDDKPAGPAGGPDKKPDFPPFKEVSDGFEQINSSADGKDSFYGLWKREKDGQLLVELPRGWQSQKQIIATTVPEGELFAGLQMGEYYCYWKRIDKRMLLVMPNVEVRSTGDRESKDSIKNHFTDRVLVDVPIACMGPSGQPVIDADDLFAGKAGVFYGPAAAGTNARLATIAKAKAFPQNIELGFTMPGGDGVLRTIHYSISLVPEGGSYQPRVADERVGFFTIEYRDLGKFRDDDVATRYITRWNLEKADPKLKMSPPKEPIVYYIDHTVPVRYRRYVREGILAWNRAYEKVGIKDAIEVYYQDAATGAHMDKDPEDVRYNFVRWLSNDIGTAIGPSRAHPLTGQILDADVVLTDGWIRHFWYQSNEYIPQVAAAMEGYDAETLAWLDKHPTWDPRLLLASPLQREQILQERAIRQAKDFQGMGIAAYNGQPIEVADHSVAGRPEFERLAMLTKPRHGLCMAADGQGRQMALMGLAMQTLGMLDEFSQPAPEGDKGGEKKDGEKKEEKKDEGDKIDGIPEWFIGPALAELTAHEIGHTLGLRHNFKGSSAYDFSQINSPEFKGRPLSSSVMDYLPLNINMDAILDKGSGKNQGEYVNATVGPYDMWAIEYGYTLGDTKEVLKRVNEPELAFQTDEDTGGPDPYARRYDHYKNPMDYAQQLVKLAQHARTKIIDKFVKDGDPWAKARRGYGITLGAQSNAANIMANWIGGSHINRDRKGDPGNRAPIEPVSAEKQRAALKFVLENTFRDETYGLTPDLLLRLTANKNENAGAESVYNVHDSIAGVQGAALTTLMSPSRLRRIFDNEFTIPADQDAFTLAEMMDTISGAIWTEMGADSAGKTYTARKPMVSSLRRNLQNEHVTRLIDLALAEGGSVASKAVSDLARAKLRELAGSLKAWNDKGASVDPYTRAHLADAQHRIEKALDAGYQYGSRGGGGSPFMFFGQPTGGETKQSETSSDQR